MPFVQVHFEHVVVSPAPVHLAPTLSHVFALVVSLDSDEDTLLLTEEDVVLDEVTLETEEGLLGNPTDALRFDRLRMTVASTTRIKPRTIMRLWCFMIEAYHLFCSCLNIKDNLSL